MERRVWRRGWTAAVATAVLLAASGAEAIDFVFTGQCDDCAFNGAPGDPGFDPLDDGLFQSVSGTLVLSDATPNAMGNIDVGSGNFVSFTYGGSALLNPFTFTDPFLITGELSASGAVLPGGTLRIETSAGDFSNFCTALGEAVLAEDGIFCDFIGIATFSLASDGSWTVSGTEPFDVGVGGALALPEPTGAATLGLAAVALVALRRMRR